MYLYIPFMYLCCCCSVCCYPAVVAAAVLLLAAGVGHRVPGDTICCCGLLHLIPVFSFPARFICNVLPGSTVAYTAAKSSVITGMRGAKVCVSPPRRSPPCNKLIPGTEVLSIICDVFVVFRSYLFVCVLFVCAPFAQTLKEVERGRPSGHSRRNLGSIRAVCRAWRAYEVFFSAGGVDRIISRVFFLKRYFGTRYYPPFFEMLVFLLIHTYPIENDTARNKTLGSTCRDRFTVHYHPSLGALRAVCRVSRAHVCTVCNARLFS